MEDKKYKTPPRKGPRMRGAPGEKAKDFKSAMKRLFKELKPFRIIIIVSVFLAGLSSVTSILAPSQLSNLTD